MTDQPGEQLTVWAILEKCVQVAVDAALGELQRQCGDTLDPHMMLEARSQGITDGRDFGIGAMAIMHQQIEAETTNIRTLTMSSKNDARHLQNRTGQKYTRCLMEVLRRGKLGQGIEFRAQVRALPVLMEPIDDGDDDVPVLCERCLGPAHPGNKLCS